MSSLAFTEKRGHLKALKEATKALNRGGLGFKEKRQYQTQRLNALKALKGVADKLSDIVADLIAGKFNKLSPAKFRQKLVDVSKLPHDFEAVKQATANYLEVQFKDTPMLESISGLDADKAAEIAEEAHNQLGKHHKPFIPWDELAPGKIEYAIDAVMYLAENPNATAKSVHEHWIEHRRADGWMHGETLDQERKTHPSMIEYSNLSQGEIKKDQDFLTAVRQLMDDPIGS